MSDSPEREDSPERSGDILHAYGNSSPVDAEEYQANPNAPPTVRELIQVMRMSSSFRGPLPPPDLLEQYGRIVPNGAERIFKSFESQTAHRQALETATIQAGIRMQFWGFCGAYSIAVIVLIGGFALAALGKSLVGMAAVITALVGLTSVFFVSKAQQTKELKEKSEALKNMQSTDPDDSR